MQKQAQKILFCTSEALPFIKTGGLADVAGSLPKELSDLGEDVTLVLPAYRTILDKIQKTERVGDCHFQAFNKNYDVTLLQVVLEDNGVRVLLVDVPDLYYRNEGPYLAGDGRDWWDNGERFSIFSKAVVEIAMKRVGLDWKADVVHSHDWQTGLVSALLTLEEYRPKTVYTIHNMAYQGNFPHSVFVGLGLPAYWWHTDGVEFHGFFSMLKAGISMSDYVTTVSPTYANEICEHQFAYGMEGLLQKRRIEGRLTGILNGIDLDVWNPKTDTHLVANYSAYMRPITSKAKNKHQLLKLLGATEYTNKDAPLLGFVGRLVEQKGIDLVLDIVHDLVTYSDANFVFLGSDSAGIENTLRYLSRQYPSRVFTYIGYSENIAHLVEAGSDMFLMPSRFEPCGLNQMYSLIYGTMPIVHHTGGLADTVVNATVENIDANIATGFVFYEPTAYALKETIYYALQLYKKRSVWRQIQQKAMKQNLSWTQSAKKYRALYNS